MRARHQIDQRTDAIDIKKGAGGTARPQPQSGMGMHTFDTGEVRLPRDGRGASQKGTGKGLRWTGRMAVNISNKDS